MYFAFLKMSNLFTGPEGNSTSSVRSFFNDVGHATAKFGKHLVKCVTDVYEYTIGKIVYRFSEDARSLKERKASIENDKKAKILIMEMGENTLDTEDSRRENAIDRYKKTFEYRFNELKRNLKFFFTNDTVRHVAKFLLFAAGTALFIPGMFSIPGAIAAFTILGIAVTRFIFKAVHIIKQASNNYFVGNRINTIVKTIFRLLIAAAEIPAFFFGGPLASLITQPISGAILGIMKAYDDIKTEKRMDKTQKWDNAKIDELYDYGKNVELGDDDDNVELEWDYRDFNIQNELYNTQDSTNLDTSSKENSASGMNIKNNMDINYA